ncbi:MAG: tRNA pseudouridine(38-40) synthase TruA [Rhabdochlamydiaceae bacterium]|nr:tRNA pseudouridine(38-40) synthase TruA [Rhabdochlamydiaceae bacterium]
MRNIKLIVCYEGTRYLGWQKNQDAPTIESALERALFQILREKVELQAASRTDAGVHAQGQVVNFKTEHLMDLPLLIRSLNGVLPQDIRILSAKEMPPDFHPTLDNRGKEYLYQICNSPFQLPFYRHISWHVPTPLDLKQIEKAIPHLLGNHDFSAFCNDRALWTRSPFCTLESISLETLPHHRLQIAVKGDHFLYKMVRNLIGTLVYIGCDKLNPDQIPIILDNKARSLAGVTAPAHGLSLNKVLIEK